MKVADFITGLLGVLTIIGLLWRIAWSMGQLVQQFTDHVADDKRVQDDLSERVRTLERRGRLR